MIPILYLAGPMSGLPDFNYPAFIDTARKMRRAGFIVVNPAENGLPAHANWGLHMRRDLHAMLDCQGIALMDGWESSKGAQLEISVARALEMPVRSVAEWLNTCEVREPA